MMQDHVVGLGSLAQTRARTPRVFRWGMRRNKHVLLSVRVSAHAKGHAPPKHSGVLAFLALTGAMPVPESDSGVHEKRYCCAGGERPHKRPAKLAASPRKAGG